MFILAFSIITVITFAVGYATRGIIYFGPGSDNEKQVIAASKFKEWRFISDMHRLGQGKTFMKDVVVLMLVITQRLTKDFTGDRTLVLTCIACNFISSICVYLVSNSLWDAKIALLFTILFVGGHWIHQLASMGAHVCVAQAMALVTFLILFQLGGGESSLSVFGYLIGGIFFSLTLFSSSSSHKYIPLLFACTIFNLNHYEARLCTGADYLFLFAGLRVVQLIHAGASFRLPAVKGFFNLLPKKGSPGLKLLAGAIAIFFLVGLATTQYLFAPGIIFFLKQAFFIVGFFSTVYFFARPDVVNNLKSYFAYHMPIDTSRFVLYREYFHRKGKPIHNRMRGAGVEWLKKFYWKRVPLPVILFVISIFVFPLLEVIRQGQASAFLDIFLIFILSISGPAWGEITEGPQVARTYLPGIIGFFLLIGSALHNLSLLSFDFYLELLPLLLLLAAIYAIWQIWMLFEDALPARMAPTYLMRALDRLGIKEFYTYDTPFNNALLHSLPKEFLDRCPFKYIKSLSEVKTGAVVVPCISAKSLHCESEPWPMKYGDFTLDRELSRLIDTKKVTEYALAQIKTFGTSTIWVDEQDVPSYRHLILNEISELDFWRGHAWVLDAAKIDADRSRSLQILSNNDESSLVGILIPTLNRADFITRTLRFYRDQKFSGTIYLADGSSGDQRKLNEIAVAEYSKTNKIKYFNVPHLTVSECTKFLSLHVTEPFIANAGDDDFLLPAGVAQCVKFLLENKEYVAAHGESVYLNLDRSGPYGEVVSLGHYPQPNLVEDRPAQRLAHLMTGYGVTIFSVHRIEAWHEIKRDASEIPDMYLGGELIPCGLAAIMGKVANLDCLYLIRQSHDRRQHLYSQLDWVTRHDFGLSASQYLDLISRHLSLADGISYEDAMRLAKELLGIYLGLALAVDALKVTIDTPFRPQVKPWSLSDFSNPAFPWFAEFSAIRKSLSVPL